MTEEQKQAMRRGALYGKVVAVLVVLVEVVIVHWMKVRLEVDTLITGVILPIAVGFAVKVFYCLDDPCFMV